jgi:hypothetical protein
MDAKSAGYGSQRPPERSAQIHFQCPLVKFPAQLRSDSIGHGGAHYFVSLTHLCPVFALFDPNELPGRVVVRVVPTFARHTRGVRGTMYAWGQILNWAAVAVAWLITFAIGIAIYFLPIAQLLGGLTD